MSIEWTRVTSRAYHGMRGFIASYWVGTVDGRTVFRIEQRKPISAGRHNTRVALLFRMPSRARSPIPSLLHTTHALSRPRFLTKRVVRKRGVKKSRV